MAPPRGAVQKFARRVRWYVASVIAAFGLGTSVTWSFYEEIFRFLYVPANGNLSPYGLPVYISPIEAMDEVFGLALKGGLVVAAPVVMFSAYRLTMPLMDRRRRRFLAIFLPVMGLFYLGGAAFAYYVMLPTGLKFLLNFGTNIAVPMITISAYMSLVTALVFWLGIVFEIPLVMFLLAKLRLVSHRRMRVLRKYVPVAALFLGMIITPTSDALNQTMVAVPIIVLYEFGLFLAWITEGGVRRARRRVRVVAVSIVRRPWGWIKWTGRQLMFWQR